MEYISTKGNFFTYSTLIDWEYVVSATRNYVLA